MTSLFFYCTMMMPVYAQGISINNVMDNDDDDTIPYLSGNEMQDLLI